ncbi:MAG: hypothetical protein LBK27_03070 [Treponema sp.]|jgi:hypothetical protein|nr:hypothetical protein [Treponema sp.]
MKKIVLISGLLFVCSMSLFAQIRNGQNLNLYSWTKDGAETGMIDQISGAVVQTNGNEVKYTLRTKDGAVIVIDFNRVSKRLHYITGEEELYSTTGNFRESGSTSIFTFTGEDGVENVLKFRRI